MKIIILPFCFLFLCLFMQAQEKQVFSETFTDNHNNWPLIDKKGLKTSVSAEKHYDVENRSKNDFSSLISVPVDLTKDFHIKMAVQDLHYNDKKSYELNGSFRFIIGAKDENSGYLIAIGTKALLVSMILPNQDHRQMYYGEIDNGDNDHLDLLIENNRWKFYNPHGNEIANIPAMPVEGTKMGILVEKSAHYALTNFTIAEKEKNVIKTDFNLALFMFAYRKLICSAWHLFIDDKGAPYGAAYDSTWYCKTNVPGFASNTLLILKKNNIELLTNRRFKTKDEAFAYYQEALSGIKLTKDTCIELSNNTSQLSKLDFYKEHFIQFDNWRSGFRDDHAQKVEGNVLLGISKGYGGSDYLLEFHIILYLSGKVFSN